MEIAAKAIENKINKDKSDYVGPRLPCQCGHKARYAGRKSKTINTVLGKITLSRAYYHCKSCKSGFFPRDHILDIRNTTLSPGVVRITGLTASMVSFRETSELIMELAGIKIDPKQAERTACALGTEIAVDEVCFTEPEGTKAKTIYLGMDGTGVPIRSSELEGRKGKQPDGSAKTREVKLVTIWTAEKTNEDGIPVRDTGSVSYSAAIESAAQSDTEAVISPFAQRVNREARRRNFDKVARQVIIGDGARWIWNIAYEHFPEAIQIVDLFHAKDTLSKTGKSIFGTMNELATQWIKERYAELDEGRLDDLIKAVAIHAANNKDAKNCKNYIRKNRQRMNYPDFRKQGLCISSGVVEAGCKVLVGTRLKRAGMHWSIAGSNAIIALRAYKLSNRFHDFWERRTERNRAAA